MENQTNPRVIRYMNWLAGQESSGGKQLFGDYYDPKTGGLVKYETPYPTSAGLFHWNNDKKPLGQDGIPSQYKRDAAAFGFDPNDFSIPTQKKVAYAKINKDFEELGDFVQVDAKWNGARIENGRYVHISDERYKALIEGSKSNTSNDIMSPATAYAAETDPAIVKNTQAQQPEPDNSFWGQPESGAGKFGVGAARLGGEILGTVTRPVEAGLKTLGAGVAGMSAVLPGGVTPQEAGQSAVEILNNKVNLTEVLTGKKAPVVSPFDVNIQDMEKTGEVLKSALGSALGSAFNTVGGVVKGTGTAAMAGKEVGDVALKQLLKGMAQGRIQQAAMGGAKLSAGGALSENLLDNSKFTGKESLGTYGDIVGSGVLGAGVGAVPALGVKGKKVLTEKLLKSVGGDKNAQRALQLETLRKFGIDFTDKSPENLAKIQTLKDEDLIKLEQSWADSFKKSKTTNRAEDIIDNMSDMSKEAKEYLASHIGSDKIVSGGKVFLGKAKQKITEDVKRVGTVMDETVDSLKNAGLSIDKNILRPKIAQYFSLLPDTPQNRLAQDDALNTLNNVYRNKGDFLDIRNIDGIIKGGNAEYGVSDSHKSIAAQQLAKIVREVLDDPSNPFVKAMAPEQQAVLGKYREAAKVYGDLQDANTLRRNLQDVKVGAGSRMLNIASGLLGGNVGGPLGLAAGSKVSETIQNIVGSKAVNKALKSKLPLSASTLVNTLEKGAQNKIGVLDTITAAQKLKTAASNRVQKTVKPILKNIDDEIALSTGIGKQKAIQIGNGVKAKATSAVNSIPTIDINTNQMVNTGKSALTKLKKKLPIIDF